MSQAKKSTSAARKAPAAPKTALDPTRFLHLPFHGTIDAQALAEEDLKKSGLTMTEMRCRAEIVRPTSGAWKGWVGTATCFPYFDPETNEPMWDEVNNEAYCRWRANSPISADYPKYIQRPGSRPRAFFPPNLPGGWKNVLADPSAGIDFTEGEKKSGKACQHGIATIGLGGIYGFKSKKLNTKFIADLDRVNWSGRREVITFDTDPKPETMANNRHAAQMLANELIARGAEVYFHVLPSISETGKTGVDDFITAKGIEAYLASREKAERMEVVEFLDDLTLDHVIERMNAKYMVVNENGHALVYEPGFDQTLERRRITRIKSKDLKEFYLNTRVATGANPDNPIFRTWAAAWLEHKDRRQYLGGVVFDPSGKSPEDVYNLWQGFHIEPVKGDWSLLHDLTRDVICDGNKEHFDYVLDWMALMIQKPAQPGEVAIAMRGLKGTGKGTLAKALHHIIGQHALTISNPKHLTGSFNAHLRDCVFLFADEAFFAGDRSRIGTLNNLITDPHLTIEGKGRDSVQAPNYLHIIMASNEDWVVPATWDERRYLMLDVNESRRGDLAYFKQLHRQLNTGGYEAMLYDLLYRDLTNFDVRAVPFTKGLQAQQKLSLPTAQAWWMECLMRGYVYFSQHQAEGFKGDWAEQVSTDILYASYTAFAKDGKDRHPLLRETFGTFMVKMGAEKRRLTKALIRETFHGSVEGNRPHGYHLGTLEDARATFCQVTKLAMDWPNEAEETKDPSTTTRAKDPTSEDQPSGPAEPPPPPKPEVATKSNRRRAPARKPGEKF